MFSLQRILGKEDHFFSLLQASAQEASASVDALLKFSATPNNIKTLDEFIVTRRRDKKITEQIQEELCTTFVTALEREDIEALSIALYRIPKTVEKIAERMLMGSNFLEGVRLEAQLQMFKQATGILEQMMVELKNRTPLTKIQSLNHHLQTLEGEADKLMLDHLRQLYNSGWDVVRVIFLKDLYELLEKVADRCRDAGNIIIQIAIKNA